MPRQSAKFRLRGTIELEEVHIIQWVLLIESPIEFKTVNNKVFGTKLSLGPRLGKVHILTTTNILGLNQPLGVLMNN